MYAEANADRPAKPVSRQTANRRLALPLSFAWGFAFAMGFLSRDFSDLFFRSSFECPEKVV
jgi:hypothetical protein